MLDEAIETSPKKAIIDLRKELKMEWATKYEERLQYHLGTIATKTDDAIAQHLRAAKDELARYQGRGYDALRKNIEDREKDTFVPKPAAHYLDELD
jgi:hypothetical protein